MPRTKPKPRPSRRSRPNGLMIDVLTLGEAAAYLRFSEADVQRLVEEQGLPARRLGNEWRFFKGAIQEWLSAPVRPSQPQGIWAAAGALKDDPYLDAMLQEIERMRGRPTSEEG